MLLIDRESMPDAGYEPASGFLQRISVKRAKSVPVEITSAPSEHSGMPIGRHGSLRRSIALVVILRAARRDQGTLQALTERGTAPFMVSRWTWEPVRGGDRHVGQYRPQPGRGVTRQEPRGERGVDLNPSFGSHFRIARQPR